MLRGARFCQRTRRSYAADRVTVAVATAEVRGVRDAGSLAACHDNRLSGRAFAGAQGCFDSLIWNDQTTLAEATPVHPAKTPSRPCTIVQRLPRTAAVG